MKTHVLKKPGLTRCGKAAREVALAATGERPSCLLCAPSFTRPPPRMVPRALAQQLYVALSGVVPRGGRYLQPGDTVNLVCRGLHIHYAHKALIAAEEAGLGVARG